MVTSAVLNPGYDYKALGGSAAQIAQAAAKHIHSAMDQAAEDIIEIGRRLQGVKGVLPHGEWGRWLDAEFGWSQNTAQQYMRVADMDRKAPTSGHLGLGPSILKELAYAPESVQQEVIEKAEAGEPVTVREVREAKRALKDPPPTPPAVRRGRPSYDTRDADPEPEAEVETIEAEVETIEAEFEYIEPEELKHGTLRNRSEDTEEDDTETPAVLPAASAPPEVPDQGLETSGGDLPEIDEDFSEQVEMVTAKVLGMMHEFSRDFTDIGLIPWENVDTETLKLAHGRCLNILDRLRGWMDGIYYILEDRDAFDDGEV